MWSEYVYVARYYCNRIMIQLFLYAGREASSRPYFEVGARGIVTEKILKASFPQVLCRLYFSSGPQAESSEYQDPSWHDWIG